MFGYQNVIVYPKETDKPLYRNLLLQCTNLQIPVYKSVPTDLIDFYDNHFKFDFIIDGLFGFSFKGEVKAPFDRTIADLNSTILPILSIDIPSGWDVENGPKKGCIRDPDVLVSLTAPKLCAKHFKGKHHVLGGRFVPPSMQNDWNLPPYEGTNIIVELLKE